MPNYTSSPLDQIEEYNKQLIAWVADSLSLEDEARQKLCLEMALLCQQGTENELAECIWKKLFPTGLIENTEDAKQLIKCFQEVAKGWLAKAVAKSET
jgi:hypothetical protein